MSKHVTGKCSPHLALGTADFSVFGQVFVGGVSEPRYFAELCLIATGLSPDRDCVREEMARREVAAEDSSKSSWRSVQVAGARTLVADALIQ